MKWYEKNTAIVLLLIFFFPVGLFLMWKYAQWKQIAKVIVSVFIAIAGVSFFLNPSPAPTPPVPTPPTPSSTSADTPPVENDTQSKADESKADESDPEPESNDPEPESNDPEIQKSVALALDSQIYENVLNSEKTTQLLQEGMSIVGNGGGNMLDLYDLAKSAKETQSTLFSNLFYLSDDDTKAYVEACQLYVSNNKTVAEKLMKYIDKQEMKYLSDAKEALERSESYAFSVVTQRMLYLTEQGLSDDEIAAMLESEQSE